METLQRNLRYPQWLQISDTFKACIFLHYEGEDIQNLSLREFQNLEQQLDSALKRIRSKKDGINLAFQYSGREKEIDYKVSQWVLQFGYLHGQEGKSGEKKKKKRKKEEKRKKKTKK
ncbi:hypothetical protein PVK06_019027 [Gossypium arboreum]|uniref:K-box domain-containing protein n=1 Tax=Gossypium arboreum TaxID=29729 RepID=A0ABR0PIX8_GOSAR|nr:hypothetical protein PVK06_019027 [Gossypium arboreum]